jgi:hypothetical protein
MSLTPSQAEEIFYTEYRRDKYQYEQVENRVVQEELRERCWLKVLDAVRAEYELHLLTKERDLAHLKARITDLEKMLAEAMTALSDTCVIPRKAIWAKTDERQTT